MNAAATQYGVAAPLPDLASLPLTGLDVYPILFMGLALLILGLALLRSMQGDPRMTIRRIITGGPR